MRVQSHFGRCANAEHTSYWLSVLHYKHTLLPLLFPLWHYRRQNCLCLLKPIHSTQKSQITLPAKLLLLCQGSTQIFSNSHLLLHTFLQLNNNVNKWVKAPHIDFFQNTCSLTNSQGSTMSHQWRCIQTVFLTITILKGLHGYQIPTTFLSRSGPQTAHVTSSDPFRPAHGLLTMLNSNSTQSASRTLCVQNTSHLLSPDCHFTLFLTNSWLNSS